MTNPSPTDIRREWAERYQAQLNYLNKLSAKLAESPNDLMTTTSCTECDNSITGDDFELSAHWIMWDDVLQEHVVVIGCQGYWQVDPSALGITSPYWMGIPGVNV